MEETLTPEPLSDISKDKTNNLYINKEFAGHSGKNPGNAKHNINKSNMSGIQSSSTDYSKRCSTPKELSTPSMNAQALGKHEIPPCLDDVEEGEITDETEKIPTKPKTTKRNVYSKSPQATQNTHNSSSDKENSDIIMENPK